MKTIQIEDDVYDHLLRNTSYIGEDASAILKRLLGIAGPQKNLSAANYKTAALAPAVTSSKIDECLSSPRVLAEREAVGRFLAILAWLHMKHGDDFEKVLMIEGRKRKYFGRSGSELEKSGNSVNPQRIPNSPFWVITNNDTPKKARMLGDALQVLGYSRADIEKVRLSLD